MKISKVQTRVVSVCNIDSPVIKKSGHLVVKLLVFLKGGVDPGQNLDFLWACLVPKTPKYASVYIFQNDDIISPSLSYPEKIFFPLYSLKNPIFPAIFTFFFHLSLPQNYLFS